MCRKVLLEKQAGFLLPLSLFVLVGLGALAIAMSRITGSSYASSTFEAVAVQSFYAAESGAQYAMNQLVFDVSLQATADANCTAVNGASLTFNTPGLAGCTATFTCALSLSASTSAHFYRIESTGTCGAGDFEADRTIAVTAVFE